MPNSSMFGYDGTAWRPMPLSTTSTGGTVGGIVVSGVTRTPQATLTRPADTTTYAAGDEISNNGTAPTAFAFGGLGPSGVITRAQMWQSANQTLAVSAELWIFRGTAAPAPNNDNAAFAPGTAQLANLVGIVPFSTSYNGAGTAGSGTAGNRVWVAANLNIPYDTTNNNGTIWGRAVVRNAYVPVASEVFAFTLGALQDAE